MSAEADATVSRVGSRRLYVQLYIVMLASTFACLFVVGVAFRFLRDPMGAPAQRLGHAAAALAESRPDLDPDPDKARARLVELADALAVDVVIGGDQGPLLASPSARPFPVRESPAMGWRRGPTGPVLTVSLGQDRWAVLRPRAVHRRIPIHPFSAALAALAVVMAAASYPVARRVTRRLEALASGVERWGRGELGHRVPVEGADEVATLAATFNQAAARIDLLIDQQRLMLANASHELRSPLARVRMAIELLVEGVEDAERRKLVDGVRRDIVELDALIEDVLLFARADARVPRRPFTRFDLRALVSEEAARTGAAVTPGAPVQIEADELLLRHLVRNLLENADRHGGGREVSASVERRQSDEVVIAVEDGGPGIPDEDRERIFAPFYRRPGTAGGGGVPGHGLGLALVRQVARYHGGEARYLARPDGRPGSRFEVTLPGRA
jgi:signal transduction histidine kinase